MLDQLYYTISEVSALTDQNKETLKKWCQNGQIPNAKKIANVWLIPKEYIHGQKILRAGVYIDNANILHGGQEVGWLVDYGKLKTFVERRYTPKILSLYDSLGYQKDRSGNLQRTPEGNFLPNKSQINFFNTIQGMGYRVIRKPLKFINGDPSKPKNNMDTYLTVDILNENEQWDVLLLFSGDSDFERLIDELTPQKKYVHIFSFSSRLSYELKVRSFNSPLVSYTVLDDLESMLSKHP